jgi:tetratricopeptide (TPR) repeat protein
MPGLDGGTLREWRRARGWDVPEMARRLRHAARGRVAAHDGLIRMIYAWERGDHAISERYELLYRKLGFSGPAAGGDLVQPPSPPAGRSVQPPTRIGSQEDDPVRRRTFVELAGISVIDALLPAQPAAQPTVDTGPLAIMLTAQMTGTGREVPQSPPDLTALSRSVSRARSQYQACRYSELAGQLPGLLADLRSACFTLGGDARLRAYALSADAYHVTAGFLLKVGDQGLAHLASDRSMSTALASQDPLTVGASARIVTHTLMSSGQLTAAIATARNHSLRLDREVREQTPESLSVYGSVLLRGAIAAAQHDERGTAHEMLAEASEAARRLGMDANLRGTAFGPVNAQLHQVNVAVTLGDAGTAVDLARQIDLAAITVTERKASLLIDIARAFFQWGRYEQAYAALRAAEETAPEEVTARPVVCTLVSNLAALAPPAIRKDAEQFATRIGATR